MLVSCTGEFTPLSGGSIILEAPVGLCEGGEPAPNNRLEVPFRWSVDKETDYQEFVIEIKNLDDDTSEMIPVSGDKTEQSVTLERGKNYEWKVIGKSSSSQIPSLPEKFFSESQPTNDNLPLPSKISVRNLTSTFEVTWTNDKEESDNLTYDVFLSSRIEPDAPIDDVTKLNYDPRGNNRSESDPKVEVIEKNGLDKGDYVVRIQTNKTENGITNTANSYSRIKYE